MPCAKFIVSGRVQGVFFRAATRTAAVRLGLAGYAKNLANGSVEVLACGEQAALDELGRWLHVGPPAAQVRDVQRTDTPESAPSGFHTA